MYCSLIAFGGAEKLKITDVLPFPWDSEQVSKLEEKQPISQEEQDAFWDEYDKNKKSTT
ncbi:hypothetical protein OD91_0852 [Lutibacter sp. Hel_I_33_5]|uniref:hypothetical protein n=1 Tax=Lutibacter sp. Hel_I_33_5 TaxID=1566289 RepID=UPI0011AC598C|nr:hypothetical protein [Lutibacter sp. Hel_I_33_5]TVZ55597.1 hypothetical protein OD91_0852 [Lutibacter sp. Hel_I_33_5]